MKRMTYLLTALAALTVMAVVLSNGCATNAPHRSEIQIQLLRTGNFHIPPKTEVTLAALPKALKKRGAYANTVILIQSAPGTPEETKKQIGRVLVAKGLSAPVFVGPRRATSGLAPPQK